ncbi:isoamyl acetate-hydrolyzing esterase [Coemansia sp. RSA 552]|nr:isoamyl acetate-hydrolyzing esterase [Coemansia sp. RSA 552]
MDKRGTHVYDMAVCIGDSNTEFAWSTAIDGWGAQLANAYLRRLDVVNRGFGGFNSRWAKAVLPRIMPMYRQPANSDDPRLGRLRLVVIMLGTNDAVPQSDPCHVPLGEFKDNMKAIATAFTSPQSPLYAPGVTIILVTPPPLNDAFWLHMCGVYNLHFERSGAAVAEYAQAVRQVAGELGLACADLWTAIEDKVKAAGAGQFGGYQDYLHDSLHLGPQGNSLLFALLIDTIAENNHGLNPGGMEWAVPALTEFSDTDGLHKMLEQA